MTAKRKQPVAIYCRISADPNDSKSFHHLGIIWDRKGRTERAREMYRQARAVAGTARG